MNSFYCPTCDNKHSSWYYKQIVTPASETCIVCKICGNKLKDTPKPKRKSFEFEGYEKYTVFRLDHIGEIKEQDGLFHFTADFMISNCYPTKKAAEKARAELIKLNEEMI